MTGWPRDGGRGHFVRQRRRFDQLRHGERRVIPERGLVEDAEPKWREAQEALIEAIGVDGSGAKFDRRLALENT